jgi:cytochrome P450
VTEVLTDIDFLAAGPVQRHTRYGQLNAAGAVHRVMLQSGQQAWLVTGYDAVRHALTDPRLQGRTGAVGDRRALSEDVRLGMNNHMLNLNPPDHTRLRRLISAAFTRRRIAALRPRIEDITTGLLDACAGRQDVDLIEVLATPLPIRVLTELIGVPDEDVWSFHGWTTTLTSSGLPLPALQTAAEQMLAYSRELLDRKRRAPQADLLSALVAVHDGDDRLTDDELTSMVFLLLIAGQETTVNLIGNGTFALLTNPEQLARLRAQPALVTSAVEEFLRYESPVHAALRVAAAPVVIAGTPVPAGAVVLVSLTGANRDGTRFPAPGRLDIGREDNPHVAFGHGIHHCLGAPLARLEGAIAIGAFFTRFPYARLLGSAKRLSWRGSLVMHGLDALPVRLFP